MRPIDQAVGFATFANGGIQRDPYFVAKVADNAGAVLLENAGDPGEQVMSADVANDVTYAMKDVASYSKRPPGRRPGGGQQDRHRGPRPTRTTPTPGWSGTRRRISTAVWMGTDGNEPIVDADGRIIYGSGLPGAIWQQFMNAVLEGTPKEDLPDKPLIQGDTGEGVPEPTPSRRRRAGPDGPDAAATPTPAPTRTPGPDGDGVPTDARPRRRDPNADRARPRTAVPAPGNRAAATGTGSRRRRRAAGGRAAAPAHWAA